MPDRVPTSGAWQTDPQLRMLMQAFTQAQAAGGVSRGRGQAEALALQRYIESPGMRQRLGIPNNYWPDPRTNGQTLYDPNQNVWRDTALTGGAMAAGGYGLGAALGGAPAAAGGGAGTITGPLTADEIFGASAVPTATATTTAAAAPTAADRLKKALTNPKDIAPFLAMIPMLTSMAGGSGGNNPFNDAGITDEIKQGMALQRKRLEQTQPVYDTLVNMSYGMSPSRYRGAAPTGYTPNAAPSGPYQYQGPRFS